MSVKFGMVTLLSVVETGDGKLLFLVAEAESVAGPILEIGNTNSRLRFALPPESYRVWQKTFDWRKQYGTEYLHAGPLFIHQLSHCWIDLCGIADEF